MSDKMHFDDSVRRVISATIEEIFFVCKFVCLCALIVTKLGIINPRLSPSWTFGNLFYTSYLF